MPGHVATCATNEQRGPVQFVPRQPAARDGPARAFAALGGTNSGVAIDVSRRGREGFLSQYRVIQTGALPGLSMFYSRLQRHCWSLG
jgi:hypothetical protein